MKLFMMCIIAVHHPPARKYSLGHFARDPNVHVQYANLGKYMLAFPNRPLTRFEAS